MEPTYGYGARHTQVILLFVLVALAYGMRVNLSVGIVAMTSKTSPNPDVPIYTLDDQGIILSSFFMGYVTLQIVSGQLARKYGAKIFLIITFVIGSIMSLVIPFAAALGSWALIVCRVVQGITQGFLYPSVHNLLSKWVPPLERSRLGAFVYAGAHLGTVISMPFTGWLSESWLGWPYAFYFYGIAGLLWTVLWIFLGKNSPTDHKTMSYQEKMYIERSLGDSQTEKPPSVTPWKAIFTSLPVWAIIIAHTGQNWGFTTLLTNIPTYMGKVLDFDIKNNGVLSAAPYLIAWITTLVFSAATDFVIKKRYMSVGAARKLSNTIGLCVPAATLLALGLISDQNNDITTTAIVLLYLAVGINGSALCGYHVNHMDISPVHAGTLMGITNTTANFIGIFAPLILQFIVPDQENSLQWAVVFYISSAIYVLGAATFVILGSGEVQKWNNIHTN